MIVNGKYVKYDEIKSANIQKDINANDDAQQFIKSNVEDPKKMVDSESGSSLEFGFSIFQDDERHIDRVQRYNYYREMTSMEFIQRGVEIIADDSTLRNLDSNVMKIYSDNETIKDTLWDLFIERIDINTELWSIVYETVQMGDNFYEIVPDSYENPTKIMYIRYLDPGKVERVELNGRLLFYTYKSYEDRSAKEYEYGNSQTTEIIYKLQPWQIIHFKVKDDKGESPYGASLLKAGVRTFRRLSLLEDVILVYRISRAPERRVFYIDVGNMNYTDAKKFMQKIKGQYRTQNFIDENGEINRKANVLSVTSDIFVPQKEGGVGTKIDTLQGGEALKSIEDLDYFKNKILRLMNIPPAYLGDEADRSQGGLSQLDYRFSRFIERIQTQIFRGLEKIAAVELYFQGYKKADLNNFKLEPTPSSNIAEITDIDIMNQRMSLITTIRDTGLFDNEWILKNVLKLSNKEIADINLRLQMQKQQQPEGEDEMGAGGFGAGGMDMGAGGEMGGEELPPEGGEAPEGGETTGEAPTGEAPPAGGETPPEESVKTKEEMITESLVEVLGKKFIIKESKDFFEMMKYIKEDRHSDIIPLIERTGELLRAPIKRTVKTRTEGLGKQMLIGELTGLSYTKPDKKGKVKRVIKLYEGNNEKAKEKKILLEN